MRLFNLLTTRADIDHPLCAECTQILLSSLQRQLDETRKERDGYIAFEKGLKKERERESQDMGKDEADKKIEKLKMEERVAIEQLRLAEQEREQLDEELRALELEERVLEEEEAESVFPTYDGNVYLSRLTTWQVLAWAQRISVGLCWPSRSPFVFACSLRRGLCRIRETGTYQCLQ